MMKHCISICTATLLAAEFVGCGSQETHPPSTDATNAKPSAAAKADLCANAPFEYKLISKEETMHTWGPQVVLKLETTNEVAKNSTKDDLHRLWQRISPSLGDRRVFLYLRTHVPGAAPWAVISRVKTDGEWRLDITVYEHEIAVESYRFVNEIDRSVQKQRAMIVTLPMVNHLNEQLVRRGWAVRKREEDFYSAEFAEGAQAMSVTVTPEKIDIHTFGADGNALLDAADIVFSQVGIADDVKKRLDSVIGSSEYVRVAPGKPARWTWKCGKIDVSYARLPQIDNLSASYAQ